MIGKDATPEELYFSYPIDRILADQSTFFEQVKFTYVQEKLRNPVTGKRQFLNLAKPGGLSALDAHLKVHSITGLPELGTSNTVSIPYWDRQAFETGLVHQFRAESKKHLQENDIENINALRAFLRFVAAREVYAKRASENLEELSSQKQFTRSNIDEELETQRAAWIKLHENYRSVLISKLKHTVFLVDKIENWDVRAAALKELDQHAKDCNIKIDEMEIDLGVDGGVTADTSRPPYQIHMIKQLRHLGKDEVSVSPMVRATWPVALQRESILRPPGTASLMVEPPEYQLDWNFDDN